jgi:hypothetical protein
LEKIKNTAITSAMSRLIEHHTNNKTLASSHTFSFAIAVCDADKKHSIPFELFPNIA